MKQFFITGLVLSVSSVGLGQTYFTGFESTENPTWNPLSSTPFNGPWGSSQGAPFGVVTTTTAQGRTSGFTAVQGTQVATFNQTSSNVTNATVNLPQFNPGSATFTGFSNFGVNWKMWIDSANTGSGRQFGMQLLGIRNITSGATTFTSNFMLNDLGQIFAAGTSGTVTNIGTVANVTDRWVNMGIHFDAASRRLYGSVDGVVFTIQNDATSLATSGITTQGRGWGTALFSRGSSSSSNAGIGRVYFDSIQVVPEPGTMAALGLGAIGLIAKRRRKVA